MLGVMARFKEYSDDALLDLLKVQDVPAFEEIYRRYWRLLYSIVYKRLQSRECAEEIVQDIFTSLWARRRGAAIESLSAYLTSAAKYKVINHVAREMSRRAYAQTKSKQAAQALDNCTEEAVWFDDLDDALEREIDKLPARRREIVRLHKREDLSLKQVAGELGISEKTVENQFGKAIKTLKLNLRHFTFFAASICAVQRLINAAGDLLT